MSVERLFGSGDTNVVRVDTYLYPLTPAQEARLRDYTRQQLDEFHEMAEEFRLTSGTVTPGIVAPGIVAPKAHPPDPENEFVRVSKDAIENEDHTVHIRVLTKRQEIDGYSCDSPESVCKRNPRPIEVRVTTDTGGRSHHHLACVQAVLPEPAVDLLQQMFDEARNNNLQGLGIEHANTHGIGLPPMSGEAGRYLME